MGPRREDDDRQFLTGDRPKRAYHVTKNSLPLSLSLTQKAFLPKNKAFTIMSDDDFELITPQLNPPLKNSASPRDLEPTPQEIEKLRKWQEDRIARKLRGEYESAILHLSQVVSYLSSQGLYCVFAS